MGSVLLGRGFELEIFDLLDLELNPIDPQGGCVWNFPFFGVLSGFLEGVEEQLFL